MIPQLHILRFRRYFCNEAAAFVDVVIPIFLCVIIHTEFMHILFTKGRKFIFIYWLVIVFTLFSALSLYFYLLHFGFNSG